jgi:hypothetical protein
MLLTLLDRPACGTDFQNAMATDICGRVGRVGNAVVSPILLVYQLGETL